MPLFLRFGKTVQQAGFASAPEPHPCRTGPTRVALASASMSRVSIAARPGLVRVRCAPPRAASATQPTRPAPYSALARFQFADPDTDPVDPGQGLTFLGTQPIVPPSSRVPEPPPTAAPERFATALGPHRVPLEPPAGLPGSAPTQHWRIRVPLELPYTHPSPRPTPSSACRMIV